MEISFNHRTLTGYRELPCPVRRIQVTAESVVPDTDEDVGSIVSVQPMVLLKSKDVTPYGVTVSGEFSAALLCVTEGESRVSCVRMKREFSMDFALEGLSNETLAQIRLSVGSTEARVLNPRKLGLTAELVGELSCYRQEELPVETELPEAAAGLLHCREEKTAFSSIDAVCEKSFAFNEQFRFPEGKGEPTELLCQTLRFEAEEVQQVGSRAVVKGSVYLELCCAVKGESCPAVFRFSAPFSQLVDSGAERCDSAAVRIETTSAYFDLVDTISGEKAVDTELHAVLQLVSFSERELKLITDAYSNRCPTEGSFESLALLWVSPPQRLRLTAEEALPIAEDCAEILSVLPSLPPLIQSAAGLGGAVNLDILYRSTSGALAAVHRTLPLEEESCPASAVLCGARLAQQELRPEGNTLRCRLGVEAQLQRRETVELRELAAVSLEEEKPFDRERFASVTLVRDPTEPLWNLARRYHSSVGAIEAANRAREETGSRVLLIPKE